MKKTTLLYAVVATTALTLTCMAQTPAYVPTSGLQGWWPFTGNANDLSVNGNNGTVNGTTLTTDRNNSSNSAYFFNGTSNYISCNIASLPTGSAPRSISSWMQTTSGPIPTNVDPTVITIAAYGVNAAGLVIFGQLVRVSTGKAYFETGSSQNEIYSTTTINDGSWHHVVTTYGGPGTRVRLYIDGVKEDSTAALTLATGNSFFGIGKSPWANTYFQGKIDDVGFWNRVLTEDEIKALYFSCGVISATCSPNQTVTAGNNAQFTVATSATVSAYQWQTNPGTGFQNLSNVTQYSGVNTPTLTVTNVTPSNNNQPFRCVVTSNACTYTSSASVLTVSNTVTGIPVSEGMKPLQVFPIPTANNITLLADGTLLGSEYQIVNQLGEVVLKGELTQEKQIIPLEDLTPGVYFVHMNYSTAVLKIFKSAE